MDSITQALFGATVACAGFRTRLGRRALAAGAVVATVPDLDVVVGWIGDGFDSWLHHRGLTHSILFAPVVGPMLGWAFWRTDRRFAHRNPGPRDLEARRAWMWLCVLALLTHPLIDAFTSYGTQLLYPFSRERFAIEALSVLEPPYTLILLAAVVAGSLRRVSDTVAQSLAGAALIAIGAYSLAGWAMNEAVRREARAQVGRDGLVDAYPLLLQPVYRRVIVRAGDRVRIGYLSLLAPKPVAWLEATDGSGPAIDAVKATREGRIFTWFAQERTFWRATPRPDGTTLVEANDLRYGMPGADWGQWGIRATIGADGRLLGPPTRFGIPRDASSERLRAYWRDIAGG